KANDGKKQQSKSLLSDLVKSAAKPAPTLKQFGEAAGAGSEGDRAQSTITNINRDANSDPTKTRDHFISIHNSNSHILMSPKPTRVANHQEVSTPTPAPGPPRLSL